jgi:N-carbamoyl-L-amino-acid hydrolase
VNSLLAPPEPDRIERAIADVAEYRSPEEPGWTRLVFSDPYVASRDLIVTLMRDAGLRVERDGAGNIIGVLDGEAPSAPALVTGSHTDTVHGGGRFDGVAGVIGAIEAVHCLRASGVRLAHELRVVDFVGEEPNAYGTSCVGSRAIANSLERHLGYTRADGRALGDAFPALGVTSHDALTAGWAAGSVRAFVELHIEQGPVLERLDADVGIVASIVGVARLTAEFTGRRDHAGTTPMTERHDAGAAAAQAMHGWEQLARADGMSVATVGSVAFVPGAVNIVPERAEIVAEVRSPTTRRLRELEHAMDAIAQDAAASRGCTVALRWSSEQPAVSADNAVRAAIERSVVAGDRTPVAITSGAEHDTVQLAAIAPVGMIFMRSRDGRSHCPEEWTDTEAITAGVGVLARTLIELDGER